MGYESSTIYTMGTALSRALEEHAEVSVLVDGTWLTGHVVQHDGVGVVLEGGDEHSIVKVDRITAVKVVGHVPWRGITEGDSPLGPTWDSAMPMPGPRPASDG